MRTPVFNSELLADKVVLAWSAVRNKLTRQGTDIIASPPEAFAKFASGEMKAWGNPGQQDKGRRMISGPIFVAQHHRCSGGTR